MLRPAGLPTNAKTRARERRIMVLVERCLHNVGLDRWDITVQFGPANDHDDAACNADDEYLRATLYFNLEQIAPDDEARFVRHEVLHAATWELVRVAEHLAGEDKAAAEMIRAASERVVTTLEKMPIWDRA